MEKITVIKSSDEIINRKIKKGRFSEFTNYSTNEINFNKKHTNIYCKKMKMCKVDKLI